MNEEEILKNNFAFFEAKKNAVYAKNIEQAKKIANNQLILLNYTSSSHEIKLLNERLKELLLKQLELVKATQFYSALNKESETLLQIRIVLNRDQDDDNVIIAHNIAVMESKEVYGMWDLSESMGGYARQFEREGKIFKCAAKNFYYDCETGLIVLFSNYRPNKEFLSSIGEITIEQGFFRIAIDTENKPSKNSFFSKLIEFFSGKKWGTIIGLAINENSTPKAKRVLRASATAFNKKYSKYAIPITVVSKE